MSALHYPGAVIGIIGSSDESALLVQEARRLGYQIINLTKHQKNSLHNYVHSQEIVPEYTEENLTDFSKDADLIIIEPGELPVDQYNILKKAAKLTLSEDLIAMTSNRLLEKTFLDTYQFLVTPFNRVVTIEDVQTSIESIGYPCSLKTRRRDAKNSDQHVILYSEADLPAAKQKLAEEPCILEAWIPAEHEVSLTVVRNHRGEVLIYPTFEIIQETAELPEQVRYPAPLDSSIDDELKRIAHRLAETVELTGSLTIHFLITSPGVIYIDQVIVGLGKESVFTIGSMSVNQFEASLRGMTGLPLPSLYPLSTAALAMPIEKLNYEAVMTQFMLRTDWGFALIAHFDDDRPMRGQIIITGNTLEECDRQIVMTGLLNS